MAENTKIPSFDKFSFQDVARDKDTFRNPSPEEMAIFLNRHPYVHISCANNHLNPQDPENFPSHFEEDENPIEAFSQFGWLMTYDCAVGADQAKASIYMPHAQFAPSQYHDEETDSEETIPTLQNMSFFSALELIDFCSTHGWSQVHIEKGTDICKFAVWAACRVLEIPCTGFDATGYDELRFANSQSNVAYILNSFKEQITQASTPTPGMGSSSNTSDEDPSEPTS